MQLNLNISLPLHPATIKAEFMMRDDAALAKHDAQWLKEVSEEFEILLVEQMFKIMRTNVPESPLFGENRGMEIFREMLDGEFARLMVSRGGIGMAQYLRDGLNRASNSVDLTDDSSFLRKAR